MQTTVRKKLLIGIQVHGANAVLQSFASVENPKASRFALRQSGVVLVLVLWLLSALTLLAGGLAVQSKYDARVSMAQYDRLRVNAATSSGTLLLLTELIASNSGRVKAGEKEYQLSGMPVRVRYTPAEAYINLNGAGVPLLSSLLIQIAKLEQSKAEILAHRILDWRDPDDIRHPFGAERDEYVSVSNFRPRNDVFYWIEDLLQVLGLQYSVYDSIRQFVYVHGAARGVDPLFAPPEVLQVIALGEIEVVEEFLSARAIDGTIADTTRFAPEFIERANGQLYRVDADVDLRGSVWRRTSWVHFDRSRHDFPWTVLSTERAEVISGQRRRDGKH